MLNLLKLKSIGLQRRNDNKNYMEVSILAKDAKEIY